MNINLSNIIKFNTIADRFEFEKINQDNKTIAEKYSDYYILPEFCDFHSHFPQLNIIGFSNGSLLDWLKNLAFPAEMSLNSFDTAYKIAFKFFETGIKYGTGDFVTYSTSSEIATDAAFQAAKDLNIRAMIGNTLMDRNAPTQLLKSAEENIAISERICRKWHNANNGKLRYIVTPRFAISCSDKLLRLSADFAKSNDLYIQTHLSENRNEISETLQLFPFAKSYTDVYRKFGLLTDKTLLAHCIYLNDSEIEMIKEAEALIVHCPSSNIHLASGIMPLQRYLQTGLKLAIGSDVGAGESLSMLAEMKNAVEVSKILSAIDETNSQVNPVSVYKLIHIEQQKIFGKSNAKVLFKKSNIIDNPFVKSADDIYAQIMYKYANKFPDKVLIEDKEVNFK